MRRFVVQAAGLQALLAPVAGRAQTVSDTAVTLAPAAGAAPYAAAPSLPGAPTGSPASTNPAISVIGWFQAFAGNDASAQDGGIEMREAELAFQAPVDPFTRAEFFMSAGAEGLDVEEATVTWLALPLGTQAKLGKFRADLGKFNRTHYGQQHIMPSTLGNSAPMAEGSPFFLFITGGEILRSRAPLGGQSLNCDMEQEVQCS
jgi:hypothetical protein